jgi:predicted alpha/beta superfamily hydrolase
VLWVTDGSLQFPQAVTAAEQAAGRIREIIIVGVGVPPEHAGEFGRRRVYDFTPIAVRNAEFQGRGAEIYIAEWVKAYGDDLDEWPQGGGPRFLDFIKSDLRAEIADRYRTNGDHTFFGYSRGGAFCFYALLSDPTAFSAFIAGSPTLPMCHDYLFRMEEDHARGHSDLKARLFMSVGEGEMTEGGLPTAVGLVSAMARMVEILTMRQYPSLELHSCIFPGDVRHDLYGITLALYTGLTKLLAEP